MTVVHRMTTILDVLGPAYLKGVFAGATAEGGRERSTLGVAYSQRQTGEVREVFHCTDKAIQSIPFHTVIAHLIFSWISQ